MAYAAAAARRPRVAAALSLLLCQCIVQPVWCMPYREDLVDYNLNTNAYAGSNLFNYSGDWPEKVAHGYTASPENWRELPVYTVLLDKLVDGEPSNNDFFGTQFEWDPSSTQLRHGGDIKGLTQDRVLDWIYDLGYRTIYIAGTIFVNMPWGADQYSPLDFTLLDPHLGRVEDWRAAIDKIHAKGMYIMLDFTTTTMGDMLAPKTILNSSAPFDVNGYEVTYKRPPFAPWGIEEYPDFTYSNTYNSSCELPVFWDTDGTQVPDSVIGRSQGCYSGDFDQFGDVEAFGVHADWKRQLSKFASVQDRLREWDPVVSRKLQQLTCLTLRALDIDAARVDKAQQQTVAFGGDWGKSMRECARSVGKENFFITGEVTGGNTFGALYYGRGRTPSQLPPGFEQAATITSDDSQYFLRPKEYNSLDSAAFHYSVYRSLTRYLGMDGNLEVAYDVPVNWVTMWNIMFVTNDFINANTGKLDPRHLYGTSNQDVFRWPSLINGRKRGLLGQLVTNVIMPGIPLAWYGEEAELYALDNTNFNYIFGRQPMTSTKAWQTHSCYKLGSEQYYDMPLGRALEGCHDDGNSLDHFDPTREFRRALIRMGELRSNYAVLRDGFNLAQLGNWTTLESLPGSREVLTEKGLQSVVRSGMVNETLTGPRPNTTVWILFSNLNETTSWSFDCGSPLWISSPYMANQVIKNLFYPYETYNLSTSLSPYYLDGQAPYRGCMPDLTLPAWGFKAFTLAEDHVPPAPRLTNFYPGHDARLLSQGDDDLSFNFSLQFDNPMWCLSVANSIKLEHSLSSSSMLPYIDYAGATCTNITRPPVYSDLTIVAPAVWEYNATVKNAPDGLYELIVTNPKTEAAHVPTGSSDHLMIRKGRSDNPMVFFNTTYDNTLLSHHDEGLYINHRAYGAERFRYSLDFGVTWKRWQGWQNSTYIPFEKFGKQEWKGKHIKIQYWSAMGGSAAHVTDADVGWLGGQRRFPELQLRGAFNQWGYDAGSYNKLANNASGDWHINLMAQWPQSVQLQQLRASDIWFLGDVDGDGSLDLMPPNSQAPAYLNMSRPPAPCVQDLSQVFIFATDYRLHSYLAYTLTVDENNMTWSTSPRGHQVTSIVLFALLAVIPLGTGLLGSWLYMRSFYPIKINTMGPKMKKSILSIWPSILSIWAALARPASLTRALRRRSGYEETATHDEDDAAIVSKKRWPENMSARRKVLIATMEYEIFDWSIKVKIGGLGVMSSLMGKAMPDSDLIWVVPKVGDLDYPQGNPEPAIHVTIFGEKHLIDLQTHTYENITYYLLDSHVFRKQTKSDPYPARMDDLDSGIVYSTFNQCIAEVARRNPDLSIYHINDYHGALAPLYLLPRILPVCLSLHNAEFQGLWPLRSRVEEDEVCGVFNLSRRVVSKYIQFGNVFNLLHAAASYIAYHQDSVGVAGVSEKYGRRSKARYPALWILKSIDSLPNPDPTDVGALDLQTTDMKAVQINASAEEARAGDKQKAQEWANLKQDPAALLFVFVGRWSLQKGVDLIADVFPEVLDQYPRAQLVAIGPVVDLYGRFAAAKLEKMMQLYPGRVYSRPEFTALPPFLFSGADFALIPSRDEPFGLVAVEFGRKGALGVGSRLGGLGLMPGWWFPVESDSVSHLHSQFMNTIKRALSSSEEQRAVLRARSALQRFPVLEWRSRLESMHKRSISVSKHLAGGLTFDDPAWSQPGAIERVHEAVPDSSYLSTSQHSPVSTSNHDENAAYRGVRSRRAYGSQTPTTYTRASAPNSGTSTPQLQYPNLDAQAVEAMSGPVSLDSSPCRTPQSGYDHGDQHDSSYASVAALPTEAPRGLAFLLEQASLHLAQSRSGRFQATFGADISDDASSYFSSENSTISYDFAPSTSSHDTSETYDSPERGPGRSLSSVSSSRATFSPLMKAIEDFTDQDGKALEEFKKQLEGLKTTNSKKELCIERYLVQSERTFFKAAHVEKLQDAKRYHQRQSSSGSWGSLAQQSPVRALQSPPSLSPPGSPLLQGQKPSSPTKWRSPPSTPVGPPPLARMRSLQGMFKRSPADGLSRQSSKMHISFSNTEDDEAVRGADTVTPVEGQSSESDPFLAASPLQPPPNSLQATSEPLSVQRSTSSIGGDSERTVHSHLRPAKLRKTHSLKRVPVPKMAPEPSLPQHIRPASQPLSRSRSTSSLPTAFSDQGSPLKMHRRGVSYQALPETQSLDSPLTTVVQTSTSQLNSSNSQSHPKQVSKGLDLGLPGNSRGLWASLKASLAAISFGQTGENRHFPHTPVPVENIEAQSRPLGPSSEKRSFFSWSSKPSYQPVRSRPDSNKQVLSTIQITLQSSFMGWPLYGVILALGQILCATSFQLSLLGGQSAQTSLDLYVIGAANILGSLVWYTLFNLLPSTYCLAAPWAFFGLAFFLIGVPSMAPALGLYETRHPIMLAATSCYALASGAGFLFFSANFGEEAGVTTDQWVYRALIVQGIQQIWGAALWYWGFRFAGRDPYSTVTVPPVWINGITLPVSLLCFGLGYVLFKGLPQYYRQLPGRVPSFVKTLLRRRLAIWFLASEVLRNYWLSGPYGRNWSYLWSTARIPMWTTVILVAFFFILVWSAMMIVLARYSKIHTWIMPIFACCLGAPRWCQMLWGVTSIALYIPWGGAAGPYLGTGLWLWLGVLDSIQGVGLGMMLLQTLSRVHVAATLFAAQVIGASAVMVARATAPNKLGPGNVFPELGLWDWDWAGLPLRNWEFWIALACQLVIVGGYLLLFRREQLSKP